MSRLSLLTAERTIQGLDRGDAAGQAKFVESQFGIAA